MLQYSMEIEGLCGCIPGIASLRGLRNHHTSGDYPD